VRVAYFTAGTVGAGHLVRGLAIGRALQRAGFAGTYRMFGPASPFPMPGFDERETFDIRNDTALRDPRRAPESALADALRRYDPDLLLVDMFWAPLRFVLPTLRCEAWLLLRLCPAAWLVGPPGVPFDPGQYARRIAIEPIRLAVTETIDPVVVCNPDEAKPRRALRERHGLDDETRLVALVHAGVAGEIDSLERSMPNATPTVRLNLYDDRRLFPAAAWLGGADLVVSGTGYNSYWEARWMGYAERTSFVPLPRTIDDQSWRLSAFGGWRPRRNGADVVAEWIGGA
jgi:hypothetical protein